MNQVQTTRKSETAMLVNIATCMYIHCVVLLSGSGGVHGGVCACAAYVHVVYTVWPEILAGNLFWRIGSFESNPPIFHPPKLYSVLSSIFAIIASTCAIGLQLGASV